MSDLSGAEPSDPEAATTPKAIRSPSVASSVASVSKDSNQLIEQLSKEMIESTADYIRGEVDICVADYKALEQMNKAITEKYRGLSGYSSAINEQMEKLNDAYTNIKPLLTQIDDVEACLTELEQSTSKLDAYSRRLESKYKQFAERKAQQQQQQQQ